MPKNRRRPRRRPPLRVRLLPSLRRVLPAPLQQPVRLAHLALLLPPRPRQVLLPPPRARRRSEEHTSELQSHLNLVCRLLLEKKKKISSKHQITTAYSSVTPI